MVESRLRKTRTAVNLGTASSEIKTYTDTVEPDAKGDYDGQEDTEAGERDPA